MKINSWNDLARFIGSMTPSERQEPPRIILNDGPVELIKEAERAHDHYIRPKGEKHAGYPQKDVQNDVDDHLVHHLNIHNWERTIEKGEVFLKAY